MSSILKSSRVTLSREAAMKEAAPPASEPLSAAADIAALEPASAPAIAPPVDPAEELERARTLGYEEGLLLGRDEGLLQAQREVEGLMATAQRILAEVTRWRQDQACQDLPQVVALAIAIAERIVRRVVEVDAEVVTRTLEEAIRQREARDLVRIAVNPAQVEAVREHWRNSQPSQSGVEIVPDPSVEPGGCLLLSRSSLIDAQIATQLDAISRELQTRRC